MAPKTKDEDFSTSLWPSKLLACFVWLQRADGCDQRHTVVPPPAMVPLEAGPRHVFTDAQRQHIRAAWSESRYNPLHLLGLIAITWLQRGQRWIDHLTHLPLDFFAPPAGPGATSIIAHCIHGVPFSFGWRQEVPNARADRLDQACNVVIDSRATRVLRGGRPGACFFDFWDR